MPISLGRVGSVSIASGWMYSNSSRQAWPSGVPSIAILAWLPSSPTAVSAHSPLTVSRPRTLSPRSVKKAIVSSMSRTAMPTFSNLMGIGFYSCDCFHACHRIFAGRATITVRAVTAIARGDQPLSGTSRAVSLGMCQARRVVFRRRSKQPDRADPPQVTPLNEGEVAWRDQQLEIGRLLVERYTGANDEDLPALDRLDACIAGWQSDDDSRVDVNVLINGVGVAFGEHLARQARLQWVIATDDHGSDLALHGQPGDILVFPASTVAKRVVAGETAFVQSLYSSLVSGIEDRRRGGAADQ